MTLATSLPCGARLAADGTHFRVWAPLCAEVSVRIAGMPDQKLDSEGNGYFSGVSASVGEGSRYQYLLDGHGLYPDPWSRFQPEGLAGPSVIIDDSRFQWTDSTWSGLRMPRQVIYELHVGAFTREGTFDAAISQLRRLADLGVTCLELMPVAEFFGRFNWGYDGAALFAPYHGYGDYEALKRFVDAAHALGLGVILDVVYNHFGGEGSYLDRFSSHYETDRHSNDWGKAVNFDGPHSQPVREFIVENACFWIREFHLDGLRLDATQSMIDDSEPHVLAFLSERTRAAAAPREILLIAENEPQDGWMLDSIDAGGFGLDGMWNDDFHHAARVALTGRHDGYFADYRGRPQEFISCVKRGFLYQGQPYVWHDTGRGTPTLERHPAAFIAFLQNHDQVGNTLFGQRIGALTSAARNRAMTALLLLGPHTPLIFMGQEVGATSPFAFFADHSEDTAAKVIAGRRDFMRRFTQYSNEAAQATLLDPAQETTFLISKIEGAERAVHEPTVRMFEDLLRIRRQDPLISQQDRTAIDGAVLGDSTFMLRWFDREAGSSAATDRLLLINLGSDLELRPMPEPLLACPSGTLWKMIWSSDSPAYGGSGVIDPTKEKWWRVPADSATLFEAERIRSS